jgi:hypothetical protein
MGTPWFPLKPTVAAAEGTPSLPRLQHWESNKDGRWRAVQLGRLVRPNMHDWGGGGSISRLLKPNDIAKAVLVLPQ